MVLASGLLVLPAYGYAQVEPQAEPLEGQVANATVGSADQAAAEAEVFAEPAQSTTQKPSDSLPDASPAPDQEASNFDGEMEGITDSSNPQLANLATDQLIEESQKMSAGERYPEALEFALFAVAQEDSSEEPFDPDLIEPLINLASIQKKMQLDLEAAKSYGRAIDLVERDGGIYDARLVELINQTGHLLQKQGEHDQAIGLFQRSQHITHRMDGVYSPDQVPTLNLMTNSYLRIGNLDAANAAQNFSYMVDLHQFGRGSIESVPSMVKLARFKSGLRLYNDARALYSEAIQITEEALGENELTLVNLLVGLASVRQDQRQLREYHRTRADQLRREARIDSYNRRYRPSTLSTIPAKRQTPPPKVQGATREQALTALIRAVQIVDHHKEIVSVADRVAIYVSLGDLYMVDKKRNRGISTYQQALKLLEAESNAQELEERYFGRPRRLQYRKPRPVSVSAGRYTNFDGTFVEASFVVLANGSVQNVEVIASDAPVPMRTLFRKEVRRSIYRPRFVDGEPVATPEHLREEFAGTALPANATPAGD